MGRGSRGGSTTEDKASEVSYWWRYKRPQVLDDLQRVVQLRSELDATARRLEQTLMELDNMVGHAEPAGGKETPEG